MAPLKDALKEARARRKERLFWNAIIVVLPAVFFLAMLSLMLYNDPVAAFANLDTFLIWIPEFEIDGQTMGTIPSGFFKTPFYWMIGPFFFILTLLLYFFYFGKRSGGGLQADIVTFLQKSIIDPFFKENVIGESGMDYFGSFGSKERVYEGLLYRRLYKDDKIKRAKTLRFFTGDIAPDALFDFKGERGKSLVVEGFFKEGQYHDLFHIIEGYLFENITEASLCDVPLDRYKAFDDNTRKVKISRRALKEYMQMHELALEGIMAHQKEMVGLFEELEEHGEFGLFDENNERFYLYVRFFVFYKFMNNFVGIPAGIVTSRIEDYDLRRIIDFEETAMAQKMTISLKKINDGSQKSKVDDRMSRAFFVLMQYLYHDSSWREQFEDIAETIDPLSTISSEKMDAFLQGYRLMIDERAGGDMTSAEMDEAYFGGKAVF